LIEEPSYLGLRAQNVAAPIRSFVDNLGLELLQKERASAAKKARSLRVAAIVRNPLDMVASGYCYHHAGNEKLNVMFAGQNALPVLMTMDPFNGTAFYAKRLLPLVRMMSEVFEHQAKDVLALSFERLTESSESFDREVGKLLDFWFEDLLAPDQRRIALEAAQRADEHRNSQRENDPDPAEKMTHQDRNYAEDRQNHGSDPECIKIAREALKAMPREVLDEYYSHQRKLGYPVG